MNSAQIVNPESIVRNVCQAIGGQMVGGVCRAPSPGKSRANRSMVIIPNHAASGGIHVHMHNAPDDVETCLALKDDWRDRGWIPDTMRRDRSTRPAYKIKPIDKTSQTARETQKRKDRISQALSIWNASQSAQDSLAHEYLTNARGLGIGELSDPIRFHPALKYWHDGRHLFTSGAMVAKIIDCVSGELIGIHITYLDDSANKHPSATDGNARKMRGVVKGGCVRLGSLGGVRGVAEGIESALAFSELYGVPCDASLSADGMRNYGPPDKCDGLLICFDNDANQVGQKAGHDLARRMIAKGIDCRFKPSPAGSDWNDYLQGAR